MKVQSIPLASIIVKDRAREDKGDIQSLADGIARLGQLQPITVDENLRLVAGERRYLAHKLLKRTHIHAVIRHFDGPVDYHEVELSENIHRKELRWNERATLEKKISEYYKSHKGSWSHEDQAAERGVAQSTVSRRIKLAEAIELNPDYADYKTENDAWKAYQRDAEDEGIRKLKASSPTFNEILQHISPNYIVGDAFEGMEALRSQLRSGELKPFDAAEVDPPYGVDIDKAKNRNKFNRQSEYSEWSKDSFEHLFTRTAQFVFDLLADDAWAIFWYGPTWHHEVKTILRSVGFSVGDIPALWYKTNIAGQTNSPDTQFGSQYEPFFLSRKGKALLTRDGRGKGNVLAVPALKDKVHDTEKPLELLQQILERIVDPSSRILIPFLGSGVTLRAAAKVGCTGVGWDLSEKNKLRFEGRVKEDLMNRIRELENREAAE
jgi:ParB/RepB/Spo0J family partition protein